jgi:predicted 2-oxoglutarate/Fe(II)-dependent dioxygenase YbiX
MAAMSHYVAMNNVPLPENVHLPTINYGMYYPNIVVASHQEINLTMHYHTDFNIGEWFWPGDKFIITATTYFNDDYEGGEIWFPRMNSLSIKPKAGDIVVFPSTYIYEHASQDMISGVKYSVVIMTDYNDRDDVNHKVSPIIQDYKLKY